jgi:alkyl sulfatase BDS1-like metallo-beta-lactamase superfamily hydrolase
MTRSTVPALLRRVLLLGMLAVVPCIAQAQPKEAAPATRDANAAVLQQLPFSDRADFADAQRGFVAALPGGLIAGTGPRPAWNLKAYDFLDKDEAPPTVNPSLWRQARLNNFSGLFKITDRVYQLRGLDIANMTIVEGDSGLVVIDTLLTAETAHAGLELYYQHRPRKPVVAIIYSHSHVDHFGGAKGVVSETDVQAGRVKIYAPDGFMEHAVAENIIAGNAMSRRAQYMYGPLLPPGERGQVDTGLGKALGRGTQTLLAPTDLITKTQDERRIDGVDIVFQLTPGTEAPAEMNLYFPQFRVLDMAENATHTMHNLYTLRGAEIRDGNAWARYLDEALALFGDKTDVLIAQHHWPVWDGAKITAYLAKQRDLYKFINDQSLRLLNQGFTPGEIAEQLKLPASLAQEWALRGYYGTLRHNARAVYQKYLGWYDSNPADLDPLPPDAAARKQVEYMGGAAAVIARARDDFAKGEYRWVASVMKEVVYADPANAEARARRRCARATRISGGGGAVAQRVSRRRVGAARRRAPAAGAAHADGGRAQGGVAGTVLRFPGRAAQRQQGRGQAHRAQLDLHRPRRDACVESREFGADASPGTGARAGRRVAHVDTRNTRRDRAQADDICRRGDVGLAQDRRRCGQAGRALRAARRFQPELRHRGAARAALIEPRLVTDGGRAN